MADSVQEMSFQNVVDTILKPQGIKVGGFPDELFIGLEEKDRERWQCNICYLVLHDPRKCDNDHKFCNTCVFAWSMTYGANSDKCPVCRSKQLEYSKDSQTATEISLKWVKCPEPGCALRCTLADFLRHSHGIKRFANSDSNAMDNVRQTRRPPPIGALPAGADLVFLPTVNRGNVTGQGPVREGRNLLQDMLLVLHLEMELRRRAIDRFSSVAGGGERATNQTERDRHMAEVLAIQEQMQEITGFLNILFSIPPPRSRTNRGLTPFPRQPNQDQSSTDSDSDSSMSTVDVASEYRQSQRGIQRRTGSLVTGNRNTSGPSIGSTTVASLPRSLSRLTRRSEIRQELDRITSPSSSSISTQATAVTSTTAASTATNIIDVNNNPLTSPAANVPTSVATGSLRPVQIGGERHATTSQDRNETSRSPVESQNRVTLPRPSSTFQSALGQLPPIPSSSASATSTTSAASGLSSSSTTVTTTATTSSASSTQAISSSLGTTPAPHRRPAPPATQSRPLNTNRIRRRTVSSNNQNQATASGTSSQQANSSASNRQASQNSAGNSQNSQQNRSGLPSTSGALLRARRRSEIQQQIHQDIFKDDNN
ncbi:uncharacterized protein [Watersipora subatra]|uniref:uncharacterized protein n=1 Tax=Watersipora subatra TaxID=2589382 RepID=UPI00355B17FC